MYLKNNIDLRIVTSLAKSQFLQTQHYYLKQIYENIDSFDEGTREIILLNCEVWFKYLCRLERFFIFTSNELDKRYIITEFKITYIEIQDVIRTNIIVFGYADEYTLLFKQTTDIVFDALRLLLDQFELKHLDTKDIYKKISQLLSLYIQSIVYIMHELQNLKTKKELPFLSMTDFCLELFKFDIYPIIERAKMYNRFFGITEFKIKKYIDKDIPIQCLDILKQENFTIISIE